MLEEKWIESALQRLVKSERWLELDRKASGRLGRRGGEPMKTEAPNPNTIVWFNNKFVPLAEANVNILTHALNYGTGVFEGIRGYFEEKQQDLFLVRPVEHYERWKRNAAILRIGIPMGAVDLAELTAELCRRNRFQSHVYVRPLAYKCSARIGVAPDQNDAYAVVVVALWRLLRQRQWS